MGKLSRQLWIHDLGYLLVCGSPDYRIYYNEYCDFKWGLLWYICSKKRSQLFVWPYGKMGRSNSYVVEPTTKSTIRGCNEFSRLTGVISELYEICLLSRLYSNVVRSYMTLVLYRSHYHTDHFHRGTMASGDAIMRYGYYDEILSKTLDPKRSPATNVKWLWSVNKQR